MKTHNVLDYTLSIGIILLFIGTSILPTLAQLSMKTPSENHQVSIPREESTTEITINYAGNMSGYGGPYWQPPGETINLSKNDVNQWRNGYFTNDSKQTDHGIYINCTITSTVEITNVWLAWLDNDMWMNWTYPLVPTIEDFWEIDTHGRIHTTAGHRYSFDIVVNTSDGTTWSVPWNKTTLGSSESFGSRYTRRYVSLNCTPRETISYKPYYLNGIHYDPIIDVNKMDRLHHDQGTDGSFWGSDVGYYLPDTPTDELHYNHCWNGVGGWFDETVCIPQLTIQNIYAHLWWSGQPNTMNPSYIWSKTRERFSLNANQSFCLKNYPIVSRMYYEIPVEFPGPPNVYNNYTLTPGLMKINGPEFTTNNIYEFTFGIAVTNVMILNNRSITSFILLNVPDNDTLNNTYGDSDADGITDWHELYVLYTNPFLDDTDNDSWTDLQEQEAQTDPNNYKDTPASFHVQGNCFYEDMQSVSPLSVEIDNLNIGQHWDTYTITNHFCQAFSPGNDIRIGDVIRIIAKDQNQSINLSEFTVTSNDFNLGNIIKDLLLVTHYRDLEKFPFAFSIMDTGAMAMKQMLNYMMWNSTQFPGGSPFNLFPENVLYNRYKGTDGVLNGSEITYGLNNEIDDQHHNWQYGYFFSPSASTNVNDVLRSICVWIDYPVNYYNDRRDVDVPKPGHPYHVPVAIPAYGGYTNWMVVRGILTNKNAWPPPQQLTIYGYWLNDPKSGGIGENTYVTVQRFISTYFLPINIPGDTFYGHHLAITDPPRNISVNTDNIHITLADTTAELTHQELTLLKRGTIFDHKLANDILIRAAYTQAWKVLQYHVVFAPLFEQARSLGKPVLQKGEYIVTFGKNDVTFKITLNNVADLQQIQVLGIK